MGRITESDSKNLNSVSNQERAAILYLYLVKDYNQKEIAQEVYHNYDDWASMSISVVTRGFGFHNGKGRGRYSRVSKSLIDDFVRHYNPVRYNGGLDEGTFDRFLQHHRQQMEQQQQTERQRRQQEAAEAERRRQQQLELQRQQQAAEAERQRQQQIWAAQQEAQRRKEEAERRAREEAERQERLRKEREAQAKEAARKAAFARGDHDRLLNEALEAVKNGHFALAKAKAEAAWDIHPMIGLQYALACSYDGLGQRDDAQKWAWDALQGYTEDSPQRRKLLLVYLNNGGKMCVLSFAQELRQNILLEQLTDKGLLHVVSTIYKCIFRPEGGVRFFYDDYADDEDVLELVEELSLWAAERLIGQMRGHVLWNCAYFLTWRGCYVAAKDIYLNYQDSFNMFDGYDWSAHLGMCHYGMGDKASAACVWLPDHDMGHGLITRPLDTVRFYGYSDAILDVFGHHPDVAAELERAQRYLNGEITGSEYFGRFFSFWQDTLGFVPNVEIRWYCDDREQWQLDVFTPTPGEVLKGKAKSFLGKLFGK